MSRYVVSLVAVVVVPLAAAQGTARLEGRVLSTTGDPVAKAEVRLTMPAPNIPLDQTSVLIEISDDQGRYVFPAVPPGTYLLSSEKAGYAAGEYRPAGAAFFSSVTLTSGQVTRGVDLQMKPRAVITGRVVDADGDPVSGANVRLVSRGYGTDGLRLTAHMPIRTDDRGVFRMVDLAEGRYFLLAEDPRTLRAASLREIRGATAQGLNMATYYPGEVDARRAALLAVKLGTELTGIDIQMRRGQLHSVRGRVTAPSEALEQIPLLLKSAVPSVMPVGLLLPRNGQFEIRLPPGEYFLQPEPPSDGTPLAATGRLEFSVAASDVEGLALRLVPAMDIPGRVILDGGNFSTLPAGRLPFSVFLMPLDGTIAGILRAVVNPNGSFQISSVPTSRFTIGFSPALPTGTYVKSVRLGNRDSTSEPLGLADGRAQPIEILLGADSAELSGLVRDAGGKTIGGALVAVWPLTPRQALTDSGSRVISANASGEFRVTGIAPGRYHVASFQRIEPAFVNAFAFLRRFDSVAATITLGSGAKETIDPLLILREASEEEEGRLR